MTGTGPPMNCAARFALVTVIAATSPAFGAVTGVDSYVEHCAPCHGTDGRGRTPAGKKLGAKDLTQSKMPPEEIARRILEGAKDARGNARMPAFKDKVASDDLPALVAYVQSLRK